MSVVNSAYQRQVEPGNDYLVISEQPAWDALARLGAERLEVIADHLIQHTLRGRPRLVHRRGGGHAMPVAYRVPRGPTRDA